MGNDQQQALFERGNKLYAKAQYQEAIKVYKQSIANNYQSANVFFNMGNAYYRIGDMPSALLYYEKAHKLRPSDRDIDANIQLANSKIVDKMEVAPEFFLTTWCRNFFLFFSVATLSILNVFFWISAGILMIIYSFAESVSQKKAAFYSGIALFILGICSILITKKQFDYLDTNQHAIVFSTVAKVQSEPSNDSKTLFVIHSGLKVRIIESRQNWMRIKLSNGNEGWIAESNVKEI